MYICKIDNQEFETKKQLHSHISRKLKVKLEEYYPQYFPRRDLLTGDLIEYKNEEFYFHSLFNTRENLVKFLRQNPQRKDIIEESIKLRKEWKELVYAPSTVEARTSILPTPLLVNKLGYDYHTICSDLGLKSRYAYNESLETISDTRFSVIIDTREQNPIHFDDAVVTKLDFGDYTCRSHYEKVFIERKSVADLCGTLSKGYERFVKEIDRAKEMGAYLIIMVEEPLTFLDTLQSRGFSRATPEFIGARMKSICQAYDHVQFLFVNGRIEMGSKMRRIFSLGSSVKRLDLQNLYDSKLL